jgi:FkbM family methyltransferase
MRGADVQGLPLVTRKFGDLEYLLPDNEAVLGVFQGEDDVRAACWRPAAGEVVIDVGSHFGPYTITAMAAGATVYAVDPDAGIMEVLEEIVRANPQLPGSLATLQQALVDHDGLTPEFRAALELEPHPSMATPLDCEYSSLDKLCEEQGLKRLDWVKIDVEGLELAVLRGGAHAIRAFRPVILIEDHTQLYPWCREMDSTRLCIEFLKRFGYHIDTSIRHHDGPTPVAYILASADSSVSSWQTLEAGY